MAKRNYNLPIVAFIRMFIFLPKSLNLNLQILLLISKKYWLIKEIRLYFSYSVSPAT